jgi:predicted fused transcriptional regulator/phosphomethylpyrimidine kinase
VTVGQNQTEEEEVPEVRKKLVTVGQNQTEEEEVPEVHKKLVTVGQNQTEEEEVPEVRKKLVTVGQKQTEEEEVHEVHKKLVTVGENQTEEEEVPEVRKKLVTVGQNQTEEEEVSEVPKKLVTVRENQTEEEEEEDEAEPSLDESPDVREPGPESQPATVITNLRLEMASLKQTITANEHSDLLSELAASHERCRRLELEISALRELMPAERPPEEEDSLQRQLFASATRILTLEGQLEEMEALREQCFAAEERSKDLGSQLEQQHEKSSTKLSKLKAATQRAEAAAETLRVENAELREVLAELQERTAEAPRFDEAEIARLTQKAATADALRSENTELAIELQAVKRQLLATDQKRVEEIAEYKRTKVKQFRAQVMQLHEENSQLRQQLEEATTRKGRTVAVFETEEALDDWTGREEEEERSQIRKPAKSSRKASSIDSLIEGGTAGMKDEEKHRFLRSVGRIWLSQHSGVPL